MPFSKSSHIYDALYTQSRDYESQARLIGGWIRERNKGARSLLDVACGTGLHIGHLRDAFDVSGVDVSDAMVAQARKRNPGVVIEQGDMRTFRLDQRFDAVICMFSSITYTGSVQALNETLRNFARHLNDGGICIVEPYIPANAWVDGLLGLRTVETPGLVVGSVDRAVRSGRNVTREVGYAIATSNGVELVREIHEYILFAREEYTHAFRAAGFDVAFETQGLDPQRGMYIGKLKD